MFEIISANFGVWFNFAIPVVIALYLAFAHKEYIWQEFGIQVGISFVYVTVIYSLLFSFTTNLLDDEYWNGKVKKFEYYEEWTELVTYTESYSCGTSKNPQTCTRTKTRRDHHSPYWQIATSNGEVFRTTRNKYRKAVQNFGHTEHNIYRSGQVSFGDGDKYVSIPNIIIPTAVSHSYTNYVAAAKMNVIHSKVPKHEIKLLEKSGALVKYPTQYRGKFGELKLERFIDTAKNSDAKTIVEALDMLSYTEGKRKQVNPIIYITKEDRSFKQSLEQYWNKAKKNDAILILGVNDSGNVMWSDVIAWTNNTDFLVDCGNKFEELNVRTDAGKIVKTFGDTIRAEYIRKPMKEFEYLQENITLDWYWQLLVFLGNVGLSGFVTWKMLTNYNRKW